MRLTGTTEDLPRVVADGVSHRFGAGVPLFSGLTFTLHPGRVYALTGPSGSGKSTLLSLLAGWERPSEGSIRHEGIASVAWVFQNPHGVPGRSAVDHVALPFLARGHTHRHARQQARELLSAVELDDRGAARFRELSGGEAQRIMLARGLASKPDLFLVDEPTAQLDASSAKAVNRAVGAMAGRGSIVVIATHDPRTRASCTDVLELGPT